MPKEVLHNDTVFPETGNSSPYAIEVGWGRNTYVQLGTTNLTKDEHSTERGWFIDLDRDLINKLIRTLRKARDQAYGADE